jgi:hypothetical protein
VRRPEIEHWASQVIERVLRHEPVEDDLVELKSDWPPDAAAAARRIAAHANGARLEPILWLIGVDEKSALVKGASAVDPATWYAQVQAQFNESWAPDMSMVAFPHSGTTVVALLFNTTGAPYLVRAPNERFEVPWRGSTQTRSARRSELLSVLYPAARQPNVELLYGWVTYRVLVNMRGRAAAALNYTWQAELELYMTPKSTERLIFPLHKLSAHAVSTDRRIRVEFTKYSAGPESAGGLMTYATPNELIVGGPGRVSLNMEVAADEALNLATASVGLSLNVSWRAAGSDTVLNLILPCELTKVTPNTSATWQVAV